MKYWRHSRELCWVRIAAEAAQTNPAKANSAGPVRSIFPGQVIAQLRFLANSVIFGGQVTASCG